MILLKWLIVVGLFDLVTENILQNARVWATNELFGNPENNVGYAEGVRDAIREMGHSCELTYGTRREVIVKLRTTVIREEIQRRESNKEPVLEKGTMTDSFIRKWLIDNEVELTKQLGMEDGPPQKFLTGMFLCTSVSKVQVRYLQDVIQADGAHMSFGKYTLFSAYATTANGTMAPLGFAILFGNEDLANWTLFWKFILAEHPIINQVHKTVITDQDKGALASIQEVLPKVGHFHCSFHRRQNIKKKFGGGEGNTPLTCLWMFNLLVNQSKPANINHLTNDCSNLNLAYFKFVIRLFWKKTTRDTYWGNLAINNRYNNTQSSGRIVVERAFGLPKSRLRYVNLLHVCLFSSKQLNIFS